MTSDVPDVRILFDAMLSGAVLSVFELLYSIHVISRLALHTGLMLRTGHSNAAQLLWQHEENTSDLNESTSSLLHYFAVHTF